MIRHEFYLSFGDEIMPGMESPRVRTIPSEDGDWVEFNEAQSALAAANARIEKLEADAKLIDFAWRAEVAGLSECNDRSAARIEKLARMVAWAVNNSAFVDRVGFETPTLAYYPDGEFGCVFVDCDCTDQSIVVTIGNEMAKATNEKE